MKRVFLIIIYLCTIVCQSFVLAQTVKPRYICRYSHEKNKKHLATKKYTILPAQYFPWRVCLNGNTLAIEDVWIMYAMQAWNKGYRKYVKKRWPLHGIVEPVSSRCGMKTRSYYVAGIPDPDKLSPLFIRGCGKKYGNNIYVEKTNLKWNKKKHVGILGKWYWGFAETYFMFWAWTSEFYGVIEMQKRTNAWPLNEQERLSLFTNTMMHELGHALGVPHLPPATKKKPWRTQIMNSHGSTKLCNKQDRKEICELQDIDFKVFLKPYRPKLKSYVYGGVPKGSLCP